MNPPTIPPIAPGANPDEELGAAEVASGTDIVGELVLFVTLSSQGTFSFPLDFLYTQSQLRCDDGRPFNSNWPFESC